MLASEIPPRIQIPFGRDAADRITFPTSISNGETTGRADLQHGFPAINAQPVSTGGIPPFKADFDSVFYLCTAWLRYVEAGGGPVGYDATWSTAVGGYPQNALIRVADTDNVSSFWRSTVDNNTSNPDTGGANWTLISPGAFHPKAANFSALGGQYDVDTSAGPVTATLWATPTVRHTITFRDAAKTWNVNAFTMARNGNLLQGLAQDMTCDSSNYIFSVRWTGATWSLV